MKRSRRHKSKKSRRNRGTSKAACQLPVSSAVGESRPVAGTITSEFGLAEAAEEGDGMPFALEDNQFAALPRQLSRRFDRMTAFERDVEHKNLPAETSHNLVAREIVVNRLAHLSRRLEELHQAESRRFSEERRETWILVFALSVVLVFCFAAFFMNQMEVRDLRSGLEQELERRSLETAASFEDALDALHLERVPSMHAALEKLIRETGRRDRQSLEGLLAEIRQQGRRRRSDERVGERLEARLEILLREISSQTRSPTPSPTPSSAPFTSPPSP